MTGMRRLRALPGQVS
ncbi:hypothetical protein ACP3BO_001218 [Citrobacter freundii]|nr:hypothetical protein [Citrobacter freundii]WFZ87191.1 hypothetical protein NFK79_13750 [Citrobacter freundii]